MVFDMTGVTRDYVDMDVDYDGVEYTGKEVDSQNIYRNHCCCHIE